MFFERAKDILICCAFLVAILATMRNELCEERVPVRPKSVPRTLHQTWFGDFKRLGPKNHSLAARHTSLGHHSKYNDKPHLALRGLPRHEVDMKISLHHEVTKSAKATSLTKH
jgi:hypothetical protein